MFPKAAPHNWLVNDLRFFLASTQESTELNMDAQNPTESRLCGTQWERLSRAFPRENSLASSLVFTQKQILSFASHVETTTLYVRRQMGLHGGLPG